MPRVSVRNSVRKPISPRAGTRYSIRAQPLPWLTICLQAALPQREQLGDRRRCTPRGRRSRRARPARSACPSTSFVSTSGFPTVSSKPSRRISSTRIASWSSPRPCTSHASGRERRADAQRDVADELRSRAAPSDLARGQPVALGAGERARVDPDRDRQARLVDGRHRQRPRIVRVGDRLADRHLGQPGERDDLAGPGLVGGDAFERLGDVELGRPGRSRSCRRRGTRRSGAPLRSDPVADPQQRQPADVGARVEVRDERLERVLRGRGSAPESSRGASRTAGFRSGASSSGVEPGTPGARVCVDDRELDLRLVGVEVEEELVDLVHDLFRPRVRPVDLVDDEHDRELQVERLAQHEPRLRQRALRARRRAGGRRRPSSAHARPRRRNRRGRGCRRC